MRAATVTGAALILAALTGACHRAPSTSTPAATPASAPVADATATAKPAGPAPKLLTITHDKGQKLIAGTSVEATADGLPANRTVDLVWGTVNGGWVVEDYFHFRGKKFIDTTKTIGQAQIDANGHLSTRFTIPEDYGGVHEVFVNDAGTTIAQGGVETSQTFEMHPTEGPVGTMIELRVTGLGWRTMESTWVVNWDNQEIGWVSATSTRGTAVARFRAAGPVGDHAINVLTGYMGQGYLNHEQAPNAYLPVPGYTFRVTPGRAATPAAYAEPYQKQPIPRDAGLGIRDSGSSKGTANLSLTQGPGGTRTVLEAAGLPANADVSLVWGTYAGSRVSGNGFEARDNVLAKLKTGADGTLTSTIAIPDDLGGLHSLSLKSGDTAAPLTLARTSFVIETRVVSMTPASGPAGTPVTIHLKGVGWTEYDNIYIGTYDNAYMGYACGFNTQGDVIIHFTAAGAPGVHIIDFYPGIYQGPAEGQQLYRLPQLTYSTDHPGNLIPALRFSFEVTPPSSSPGRVSVPPLTGNTR